MNPYQSPAVCEEYRLVSVRGYLYLLHAIIVMPLWVMHVVFEARPDLMPAGVTNDVLANVILAMSVPVACDYFRWWFSVWSEMRLPQ